MTKSHLFLLSLSLFLIGIPATAWAQGGDDETADIDPNAVIEVIAVPEGMGDGVITVNDVACLAQFTTWMYDRLIQLGDPTLALDDEAPGRAVLFWDYMWDGLDPDTKVLISQMDEIYPAVEVNWASSSKQERAALADQVRELIITVWGDQTVPTASFLAAELSYDEYTPYMDALFETWQNGGGMAAGQAQASGGDDAQFDDSLHDAVSTYLGNFIEY